MISTGGVRVRKSLVTDGTSPSLVKFAIESDREQAVAVRIREVLPHGFDETDLDFDVEEGGSGWRALGDRLEFSCVLLPNDSLVTAFGLRRHANDVTRFGAVPTLERIQPIDPEVATSGGATPLWRGGGGSTADPSGPVSNFENGSIEHVATDSDLGSPIERKSSPRCLVAIPAYNEENTITDVVTQAGAYVDSVLVIDDGSEDDTVARAQAAGADVVQHEYNKGYGGALKTAFQEANRREVDHLVILDGDGQHDPTDVPRLIDQQRSEGAEIVIGSRFVGGAENAIPFYRRIGLWLVNFMTNLSMGNLRSKERVRDTQCGFRAYNKRATESLAADDMIGDHMGASTDVLYHARRQRFHIEEIDISVDYAVENASSHDPLSHGLVLISNILRTIERDRPIASLGLPGFVSALLGLGFGYWAVFRYVQAETFPVGLTMLSSFFILAGAFACFTAIMLHSLNRFVIVEQ